MQSSNLPRWITRRTPRNIQEKPVLTRLPARTLSRLLLAILIALSTFAGFIYPSYIHLPVIAASATAFIMVMFSRVKYSRQTMHAFILLAIAANLMMVYIAYFVGGRPSVSYAAAGVALFTGLIGVVIFTRTNARSPLRTKAAMMGMVITLSVAGPALYFSTPDGGSLRGVAEYLVFISIPMTFVSFVTFLVLISYHRSETTLPSDKWT
jgi:hypothetical protein